MLTPEQMKLRRQDNELRELRRENQRIENKLAEVRAGLAELLREMAKHSNFSTGLMLRKMAGELESDA